MALISIKADGTVVALSAGVRNRTTRAPKPEVTRTPNPPINKMVPRGATHSLTKPGQKPARNDKPKAERTPVGQKSKSVIRTIDSSLLKHPFYEEAVTDLRERGIDVFSTKGQSMLKDMLADRDNASKVHHTSNAPASLTELDQLKDSIASKVVERSDTMQEISKLERVEALTVEQENNLNKLKDRLVSINSYLDGARKRIANIRRKEKK